jgi:hypothetical protein
MKNIERRMRIKAIICWSLALVFLSGIIAFQAIYLQPEIIDVLFTFVVFMVAFGVRGIYQETKDTMLSEMGPVELDNLKAQIEQVLKVRGKE